MDLVDYAGREAQKWTLPTVAKQPAIPFTDTDSDTQTQAKTQRHKDAQRHTKTHGSHVCIPSARDVPGILWVSTRVPSWSRTLLCQEKRRMKLADPKAFFARSLGAK